MGRLVCGEPVRRRELPGRPVLEDPVCGWPPGHAGRHRSEAAIRRARQRRARGKPSGTPEIGTAIRQARVQSGKSQTVLAAVLGVTQQAVQRWEKAKTAPSEENWVQLELALGPLGVARDRRAASVAGDGQQQGEAA